MKKEKIKLTETGIKYQIREYLSWTGWFAFPILQSLGSYRGICDIIAIKKGKVFFIEVKTKKGKQSEYQKDFQKKIESHGGNYILVHSLDELIKKIKGDEWYKEEIK